VLEDEVLGLVLVEALVLVMGLVEVDVLFGVVDEEVGVEVLDGALDEVLGGVLDGVLDGVVL